MQDNITILMATYNGSRYVSQQIDSLLQQTHTNWRLLIRDDGSTDDTVSVLTAYKDKYPEKISIVRDDRKNLGSVKNFERLLQAAGTEGYYMFADQDDYWQPDKIALTLARMQQTESSATKDTPILVFTDFTYASPDLIPIPEMQHFTAFRDTEVTLPRLLAQNPAYGCTMMLNQPLFRLVQNIPAEAENHDYWIMLVACLFGRIAYLDKKTILYRQHGGNISGGYNDRTLINRIKINVLQQGKIKLVRKRISMLKTLLIVYGQQMQASQKALILQFIRLAQTKSPFLLVKNLRSGVRKNTVGQTVLLYLSMLLVGKQSA